MKKGSKMTAAQRARIKPGIFNAARRAKFMEAFAAGASVSVASRKAGVSSITVYKTTRKDPDFAAAFAEARELNCDVLEDMLHKHALAGNITALFGCLRARRPAVWRENHVMRVEDGGFAAAFATAMQELNGNRTATAAERPGAQVH